MRTRWLELSLAALVVTMSLGSAPLAAADPGNLVEACFAPQSLAARAGEERPVRGAKGHAQSIPDLTLPPPTPVPAALRGVIRRVALPKGKKLVALTLDLCEQPGEIAGYDGAIIDYLRAAKVKATLFTGGKWLMTHPERARQLIADGLFEIGNHGWTHRNVRGLAAPDLLREIRGPLAAYAAQRSALAGAQCAAPFAAHFAARPARMTLYRFPYGACNAAALSALADEGLLAIQWDLSTGDPSPGTSGAAIAASMVRNARPGSIIIAHANGRGYHTAEALPVAIPKLRAMGYEFVTVSELIAAGTPEIVDTCYDSRPGDTDRYDRLFTVRKEPPRERATRPATSGPGGWSTTAVPR